MWRVLLMALAMLLPASLAAQAEGEPIVIRGVIDGLGPAAYRDQNGEDWTGTFSLIVWREEGADNTPISEHGLRIEFPGLSEAEIDQWWKGFSARSMVRFTIREPVKPGEFRDFAVMGKSLELKPDPQLRSAAERLLNPPPFVDQQFGTFSPDPTFPAWLSQQREWLGSEVTVTLALDFAGRPEPDAAIKTSEIMRSVWNDRTQWDARLREAIAQQYHATWLENWRDPGEPQLSREVFKSRFKLEGMRFAPDGSITALYADDDLFSGHGMAVSYDPQSDALYAEMFG
jgi:hypothetical protein